MLKWKIQYSENLLSFIIHIRLERDNVLRKIQKFPQISWHISTLTQPVAYLKIISEGFDFVRSWNANLDRE